MKHEDYNAGLVNKKKLRAHKKKYHRNELPDVKVSSKDVPKTGKSKDVEEVAKGVTDNEIVGELVEEIKKSINYDYREDQDKFFIENTKKKISPKKEDSTRKETIGGDDTRMIDEDDTTTI